jgi:glycosyltransferase involved in cell wall biosynthesis
MRILTVVIDLDKGGTQRAAQNFCEAYAILGHDSRALALKGGGIRKGELENEKIKVWVGLSQEVKNEISAWIPEVIHLHSNGYIDEEVTVLKDLYKNARFIETNVFSIPSSYSNLLDYSYQLSDWCKYLYLSRGGASRSCVKVPYPVKISNFYKVEGQEVADFKKKYNIPEDTFIFGRIGQAYYGKWSLYLIDVFERFYNNITQNVCLLVVNPPIEILKYITERKMDDHVIIIDKLDGDDELRKCYSAIDVFLHIANQGESFGQVLAETLLCETPVITFNTPWADNSQSEVIGKNLGGFSANTVNEFYTYMLKLYLNAERREVLGKKGRKHIEEQYDYISVAKQSLYILNEPKPKVEHNEFNIKDLSPYYNSGSIPFLWMKLYLKQHKLGNYLLKRLVNFELKGEPPKVKIAKLRTNK